MTDSLRSSGASHAALAALLLFALEFVGCRTPPAGLPPERALDPVVHTPLQLPDVADHTAADLATAALQSDREAATRALRRMQNIETVLRAAEELPTGLLPVSADLLNTTLDDPRAYREATLTLLEEKGVEGAIEERLEQFSQDDLLLLARRRVRDIYWTEGARLFNSIAEPIGQSVFNTAMAPYRLTRSAFAYGAAMYTRPAITVQGRQALVHWKSYVERNPDAPGVGEIRGKIDEASKRWAATQRDRAIARAKTALDSGQPRRALTYASRALQHWPEDVVATELRDRAAERLLAQRAGQRRSLEAPTGANVPSAEARSLAIALLSPDGDVASHASALLEMDPGGPLADEARFAHAIHLAESGSEAPLWQEIRRIAQTGEPAHTNMARHAQQLLNPANHPYDAFARARSRDRWGRFRWLWVGAYRNGPMIKSLPMSLSWLIELPSMAQSLIGLPIRLVQWPFEKPLPSARITAVHARRYLALREDGFHVDELRSWLIGFEAQRGNFVSAHMVALEARDLSHKKLAKLEKKAAEQSLTAAEWEQNRALRIAIYRRVASDYPDTPAGRQAGHNARALAQNTTPTRIRVTRGFLQENRDVAGPRGLGIAPQLLDENPANGELHPDGVAFLGGRRIELSFLNESGDEDDPPRTAHETLPNGRFARLVSLLEETSYRNSLLDRDATLIPDAQRDVFFERARLGLLEEPDWRPGAESDFVYQGMRERYGMVRARESILPFDLVLRGNLGDFSFGAFPRLRPPKKTADAFLYR